MTSKIIRPGRRQLYTCVVAVAAALMLAPVSASGTDSGPGQAAAMSVQSGAHQGITDAPTAAARAKSAPEATAAYSAASAEAEQVRAEQEAARVTAEQEAVRIQAEQEAARVAAEQEAIRIQAEADAVAAAAGRVINVAYAGGQDVVDLGVGPVLYPLSGNWPPYVAEHNFLGGWDRIGTLAPGMTVTMTGLVSGTYTVGEIINVPRGGHESDLVFSVIPKVMLQTCIPGTSLMVVVGLY